MKEKKTKLHELRKNPFKIPKDEWWKSWKDAEKIALTKLRQLQEGSWSKVHLAKDKNKGEFFALKEVNSACFSEAHLEKETKILCYLDHPNIVKMHYCQLDSAAKRAYIVMEYVDGGDLQEQSAQFGDEATLARYMIQVVSAIKYIHEQGIIHRDIKPENIMVTKSGTVKLCDFGLSTNERESNLFCGTVQLTPPEMVLRKTYDNRVDLWSLGVTIASLLSGFDIFIHGTDAEDEKKITEKIMENIKNCSYLLKDGLSSEAVDLIENLVTPDPDKRLTIEEIINHRWFKKNGAFIQ